MFAASFRQLGLGFSRVLSLPCSPAEVLVGHSDSLWSQYEGSSHHSARTLVGDINSDLGEASLWLGELSELFYLNCRP